MAVNNTIAAGTVGVTASTVLKVMIALPATDFAPSVQMSTQLFQNKR